MSRVGEDPREPAAPTFSTTGAQTEGAMRDPLVRGRNGVPAVAIVAMLAIAGIGAWWYLNQPGRAGKIVERVEEPTRGAEMPLTPAGTPSNSAGPVRTASAPAPRQNSGGGTLGEFNTALRRADLDALEEFFERGYGVGDVRSGMLTMLTHNDSAAILRFLYSEGLDPNLMIGGRSLGDHAVLSGSRDVVRLILELGGPFEAVHNTDVESMPPLSMTPTGPVLRIRHLTACRNSSVNCSMYSRFRVNLIWSDGSGFQ